MGFSAFLPVGHPYRSIPDNIAIAGLGDSNMNGFFDSIPSSSATDNGGEVAMIAEMKKYYPHLFESEFNQKEFSFLHL